MTTPDPGAAKLSPFNVIDVAYKTIDSHDIGASILIPKNTGGGKRPLLVRWHGGFLVGGARLYMDWFPQWMLEYAQTKSAVIISPDYRLMPEANGIDILSDLSDFWAWVRKVRNDLNREVEDARDGLEVDVDDVLVVGESAGGYLAIQSALLHPQGIRACVAAYPVLDIESRFFTEDYEKIIMGNRMVPMEVLEDHLSNTKPGAIVSSDSVPLTRNPLTLCVVQHGRYLEFLGREPQLFPLKNLERARTLPFICIYHGRQDSAVPVEGSEVFMNRLKELHPQVHALLLSVEGEHGFDAVVTLETPWLKRGLAAVAEHWPAKRNTANI